jgi:ubiquinone/menaquinone biosynthesis C-methylase UbiE
VADDASRAIADYDRMGAVYADDAETHPVNASYERPALLALAGDLRGRRVLDLGCAAGALAERLVERGAEVVGVDVNPELVRIARERRGDRAEFHVADLSLPMPFLADASFDTVTASLVLHYIRDWTTPLREAHRVLREDGVLLISTHHPTVDVAVSDPPAPYFDTVLLTDTWHKAGRSFDVSFWHRPLSAVVDAVADAGFVIERVAEPRPDPAAFAQYPELLARMERGPWFLFIRAIKR